MWPGIQLEPNSVCSPKPGESAIRTSSLADLQRVRGQLRAATGVSAVGDDQEFAVTSVRVRRRCLNQPPRITVNRFAD
jgi:hypothetical protein